MHAFKFARGSIPILAILLIFSRVRGDIFVTAIGEDESVAQYTDAGMLVNDFPVTIVPTTVAVVDSSIFVGNYSNGIAEYTISGNILNAGFVSGGVSQIAISGNNVFALVGNAVSEYSLLGTLENSFNLPSAEAAGFAVSGSNLFVRSTVQTMQGENIGWVGEYTISGATINPSLISGLLGSTYGDIAVSGSDIFVFNDGAIGEYTLSGMPVNSALISGLGNVSGIAISGSDIFVTTYGGAIGEYTTSGEIVNANLIPSPPNDGDEFYAITVTDVPEPASLSLLLLGSGIMLSRRRIPQISQ